MHSAMSRIVVRAATTVLLIAAMMVIGQVPAEGGRWKLER
jgi:hypothetical protein